MVLVSASSTAEKKMIVVADEPCVDSMCIYDLGEAGREVGRGVHKSQDKGMQRLFIGEGVLSNMLAGK